METKQMLRSDAERFSPGKGVARAGLPVKEAGGASFTAMLGAVCGDIVGSIYEAKNLKAVLAPEALFHPEDRFTDDSVMTCAVADGIRKGLQQLPKDWLHAPQAEAVLFTAIQDSMLFFGRKYPNVGYGGTFIRWLQDENPQPYHSWGNGSAMRASYAGWAANSLEEAEKLGELSAAVTHDHPEGIKGAVVMAGCVYLLRQGASKEDLRAYVEKFYRLDFTLDEIREEYTFHVSCMSSVPQAIEAFLEGGNYAEVIALGISIGGDSDTIAAMAGSLAEVIYPIPNTLRQQVLEVLDKPLQDALAEAVAYLNCRAAE